MACRCFSWCDSAAIQEFRSRLPSVERATSPWYPYLRTAYGEERVRLPIDMKSFGYFVMPSTEAAARASGVPFDVRCGEGGKPALPRCSFDECQRWLRPIEHSQKPVALAPWSWSDESAKRASLEPTKGIHVTLPAADAVRMRFQFHRPGQIGLYLAAHEHAVSEAAAFGDQAWVEVFRAKEGNEGVAGYGCWFYPLLRPVHRGTGVFVNTGRTLVA